MEKRKGLLKKYAVSVASMVAYVLTGGLAILPLMALALVRRSRDEEIAVGYNMIAACLTAGVIMAVAKPLAFWITGWTNLKKSADGKYYYNDVNGNGRWDSDEPQVPAALVDMIGKVFDLVMYIGIVVLVISLIMAGINMARRHEACRKKLGR